MTLGQVATIEHIRETFGPALKSGGALKAVVFGSYARGEADQYSDLDIIVVAETDKKFFKRQEDFQGIFDVWRRGLDMLIYTPAELDDMLAEHRAFFELALEEGVTIYEKQR